MAAGPQGPGDPTMPVHPGAQQGAGAPPVYAPPQEQRFDRGPAGGYPPGYGYDQGQGQGGPSMQDRAADFARAVKTRETKEFFKTSEFLVWGLITLSLLIAAAVADSFDASRSWMYATIIASAYIISRGLAKAGTARNRDDHHHH